MAFNRLTPAQAERLALLCEELGEAIQAIGKVQRHGYCSYHPDRFGGPDNRGHLMKELGDVQFAVELLCATADLDEAQILEMRTKKANQVWKYLHHQGKGKRLHAARWPHTRLEGETS
jgi:NTP pyrophosphatase (non-canonical NTP hydrolase)